MVEPVRHRQTKEAGTDMFEPKATAPHLDSTATKLVKSPSNLNGLLGFVFGAGIDRNNINDLACRFKSPRNHIHNRIGRKISQTVGSFPGIAASTFPIIRCAYELEQEGNPATRFRDQRRR